jgi:hypothetical protein
MGAEETVKSIIKEYKSSKDLSKFLSNYYEWKNKFTVHQRWSRYEDGVKFLLQIGETELAYQEWINLQKEEWVDNDQFTYRYQTILRLIDFESILNKGLVDSFHIHKMAKKESQLTKFGLRNKSAVYNTMDLHLKTKYNFSFFEEFWIGYGSPSCKFHTYNYQHYLNFFSDSERKFNYWVSYLSDTFKKSFYVRKDGTAKDNLVLEAIRHKAGGLLREAENIYRNYIGAKEVGESWIGETELYYLIKTNFINYQVLHHGSPKFLGRQHLDIWIPELKIGIEYQGAQHDKPVEFFGGQKAFEENLKRDERKRQLCKENGVKLIEVREGYSIDVLILLITETS